ncbi:hypothetical protein SKAU_G00120560 [Synaphobranchus kaupii]|uniref:Uncharacterized protein n=1 Tax=Synaphobranchus kaupii TaxID=118154 RepID=A0A9Q1FP27_SYNKA|nr:hypothetical protein SKAU_G00120560 [Synaphobranchus kaupii]
MSFLAYIGTLQFQSILREPWMCLAFTYSPCYYLAKIIWPSFPREEVNSTDCLGKTCTVIFALAGSQAHLRFNPPGNVAQMCVAIWGIWPLGVLYASEPDPGSLNGQQVLAHTWKRNKTAFDQERSASQF